MNTASEEKFGVYALPPRREALRLRAEKCKNTRLGRLGISYFRKRAFKNIKDPFDICVLPGLNARLWPRSSRCEKRVFAGQQIWDASERQALLGAFKNNRSEPFVFFDVGANIGLYSLILSAAARRANSPVRITAIEPDATNRQRLLFNIKASGADILVLPYAVSDKQGEGFMGGGGTNRGEARLQKDGKGNAVVLKTLQDICAETGTAHIDAMKVDIEGYDFRALTAFFSKAPQTLWPKLLILETGREETTPLLELCTKHGYIINTRTGINSILSRITIDRT